MWIEPPYDVQQRAWDAAYELTNSFSDRLNIEQLIKMHVLTMMAPERLGWSEIGEALALWALVVAVRV